MKNQPYFILILIFGMIYLLGCSDDSNPTSPSPDLQYVGSWSGIAVQDSLNIKIENVNNKAQVTYFYIKVVINITDTATRWRSNTSGLAEVTSDKFLFSEDDIQLDGTFTSQNSLLINYTVAGKSGTCTATK